MRGFNMAFESYKLIKNSDDYTLKVDELLEHLKLDGDNSESTKYMQRLINTVTSVGEKITRMDFTTKQYSGYFSKFSRDMVIKKAPVQSIDSIEYLDDVDTWQTIDDSIYYINDTYSYPNLYLKSGQYWPVLYTSNVQPIKITFTSGFDINTGIPDDIKHALLCHAAVLYEYRGDWNSVNAFSSGSGYMSDSVPPVSALIYHGYRNKFLNW